jgi:hypothetical protein
MKLAERLKWWRQWRQKKNLGISIAVVVLVGTNVWSVWMAMQSGTQAREAKAALAALREELTKEWTIEKLTASRVGCAMLTVNDKTDGPRINLSSGGRSRIAFETADGRDRIVLGIDERSREAGIRLFGENGKARCVIASNPNGAAIAVTDIYGRMVNSLSTTDRTAYGTTIYRR